MFAFLSPSTLVGIVYRKIRSPAFSSSPETHVDVQNRTGTLHRFANPIGDATHQSRGRSSRRRQSSRQSQFTLSPSSLTSTTSPGNAVDNTLRRPEAAYRRRRASEFLPVLRVLHDLARPDGRLRLVAVDRGERPLAIGRLRLEDHFDEAVGPALDLRLVQHDDVTRQIPSVVAMPEQLAGVAERSRSDLAGLSRQRLSTYPEPFGVSIESSETELVHATPGTIRHR
jgi:hypothetical protein